MKTYNNKIIALAFAVQIILACPVSAANLPEDESVLWQSDANVYIKIAEQDDSGFGANDHPVNLNVDEISKSLGSLKFIDDVDAGSEKNQRSVFTAEQIDVLSQNLANGLAKANSSQDINFSLDRNSKKIFSLKANRLFVAGRVFYKDEKLNIIFGDYDRGANEGFEAAYDPTHIGIVRYHFDHGRRTKSSNKFKTPVIQAQGIENKKLHGDQRKDWLVIDLKQASGAVDIRAEQLKAEERARKREEIKELLDSEAEISTQTPGNAASTVPAAQNFSVEERLITLNRLRDKGLISEEEYAAKRQQLLDEL